MSEIPYGYRFKIHNTVFIVLNTARLSTASFELKEQLKPKKGTIFHFLGYGCKHHTDIEIYPTIYFYEEVYEN